MSAKYALIDAERAPGAPGQGSLTGRVDFLYVADSKLCSGQAMGHIAGRGGRFVTVMPRSRKEGAAYRDWLQTHTPVWTEAVRRNSSRLGEPHEVYCTTALAETRADRWVTFTIGETTTKTYKQAGPGWPGAELDLMPIDP